MADNFGLKIGLEGEKEFKKALSEINQSFKVLGSEMKLVSSQFDKNDSSVQALTARNTVLNKEIEAQKQKIETLRSALDNASASFGENDRRTQNWQIQLNNAEAALNDMERELKQNQDAIDAAGDEFQDAGKQADGFGDEVKGAADDADKSSGKLEKVGSVMKGVAVTIGAAVAAAGAALVGLTKSFLDLAESTREYREDQAKLDAAFLTAGFTAEQAGEAYTGFYSILGEEDRSVEAVNHLAKLGEKILTLQNQGARCERLFSYTKSFMKEDKTMRSIWTGIQIAFSAIGGFIGWLLGGFDGFLYALIAFAVIDYITGVMCAISDKRLSSEVGFKGICRKVLIFVLVGIGNLVDVYVLGEAGVLRTAVIFFYLSNEGVSLLENSAHLGLPIPQKLKSVLEQLHNRNEKEEK